MLRVQLIESVFCLCFYVYIALITSAGIEKLTFYDEDDILEQQFYSTKTETFYQCMEICSQYPLCKSLFYEKGTCELVKITPRHNYKVRVINEKQYYEANMIPKSIAGACHKNNCSIDTRCVPGISQSYVCIPHKFPTFTCPYDWAYSTKKCYYFGVEKAVSWQEAKDAPEKYIMGMGPKLSFTSHLDSVIPSLNFLARALFMFTDVSDAGSASDQKDQCTALKANLTEIQSEEDEKFLYDVLCYLKIAPRGLFYHNVSKLIWTSLLYHQNIETWIWNSSGRILYNHEDKLNITEQGNCVALPLGTKYCNPWTWTPVNCTSKNFFVCERIFCRCCWTRMICRRHNTYLPTQSHIPTHSKPVHPFVRYC